MGESLYASLKSYQDMGIYPFHMPGHKRNKAFMPDGLWNFDITEIPGMDNLQEPEGILKKLEEKVANICKSRKSFISVNGSSGAIIAALLSVLSEGDKLLLTRNSHISAYNGLTLSGASPVYIYPQITPYGVCGGVAKEDIEDILKNNGDIKAVFVTSPTYEGFCLDVGGIAETVHKYEKILVVDEAHGAHFGYHPAFPASAVTLGADISVQSLHKTLPALGQCSVIHVGSERVNAEKLKQYLNMITTTSPSYVFLADIDFLFRKILIEPYEIFEEYASNLVKFIDKISNLKNIVMPAKSLKGNYGIKDVDFGKLFFYIQSSGVTGYEISETLLKEHKIQVEASFPRYIIAMTSIADTKMGFNRLSEGLLDVDRRLDSLCARDMLNYDGECAIINCFADEARIEITPRQALRAEKESVPLNKAAGRICGDFVVPYPPGIPITVPGELITESVAQRLREYFVQKNITGINVLK